MANSPRSRCNRLSLSIPPSGRTIIGRAGTERSKDATERAPPSRALARLMRRLARIIRNAAIATQMAASVIITVASPGVIVMR